jgi:hypothetical protein
VAYVHAREVLAEARRLRPSWVRRTVFSKKARRFLEARTKEWERARRGWVPADDLQAESRRDFEAGVKRSREAQKAQRKARYSPDTKLTLMRISPEGLVPVMEMPLDDPEKSWRLDCLLAWRTAIVERIPASRDYYDYLAPHLREGAFKDDADYRTFWLEQVQASQVPANRVSGLVHHFQMGHKISHGNAGDALHARHLLDAEIFVTADQALAGVLQEVAAITDGCARVRLIDRSAPSAVLELSRAIHGR